ncbi:HK97 gp10 family phage protein [Robertmurraya massiliosenegalensis]|uniref:HK97 gp10 family phage protein n=1 Tax=Robertmurraya TaxID=2837507 RepID=UPI0039A53997
MARWGRVDYRQLQRLQRKLDNLERSADFQKFCESCAKELAARLLAKVIRRTPVGQYSNEVNFVTKDGKQVSFKTSTVKTGGTLRRGWTAKTAQEAEAGTGRGGNAVSFAQELRVVKRGHMYELEVINPVEYALT